MTSAANQSRMPSPWPLSFGPFPEDSDLTAQKAWFNKHEHQNFSPWAKFGAGATTAWDDLNNAVVHIWGLNARQVSALRDEAAEEIWPTDKDFSKQAGSREEKDFARVFARELLENSDVSFKTYARARQWMTGCCNAWAAKQINMWKKVVNKRSNRLQSKTLQGKTGKTRSEKAKELEDIDESITDAEKEDRGGTSSRNEYIDPDIEMLDVRYNSDNTMQERSVVGKGKGVERSTKLRKGGGGARLTTTATEGSDNLRRKEAKQEKLLIERGLLVLVDDEVLEVKGGARFVLVSAAALRPNDYLFLNTRVVRPQHLSWDLFRQGIELGGYDLDEERLSVTYVGSEQRKGEYTSKRVEDQADFELAVARMHQACRLGEKKFLEFRLTRTE